ncbi:MAG: hypothetical protein ACPGED_10090, partial [Flavobacteriales bacterium]
MKQILLFILAVGFSFVASAQITFIEPINLATGDPAVPADSQLEVHWGVENTGTETLNIRLRREVIYMVDGARERFCWGILCYPWDTESSFPMATH